MIHPMEMNDYAKERHQEMIAEATAYRRIRKINHNRVNAVGQSLINLGQKIKGEPTIKVRPALTVK